MVWIFLDCVRLESGYDRQRATCIHCNDLMDAKSSTGDRVSDGRDCDDFIAMIPEVYSKPQMFDLDP
jgi:hypothetical protein